MAYPPIPASAKLTPPLGPRNGSRESRSRQGTGDTGLDTKVVDMAWCQLEARACYLRMGYRDQLQPLCWRPPKQGAEGIKVGCAQGTRGRAQILSTGPASYRARGNPFSLLETRRLVLPCMGCLILTLTEFLQGSNSATICYFVGLLQSLNEVLKVNYEMQARCQRPVARPQSSVGRKKLSSFSLAGWRLAEAGKIVVAGAGKAAC